MNVVTAASTIVTCGLLCHDARSPLAKLPGHRTFVNDVRHTLHRRPDARRAPPIVIIFVKVSHFGIVGRDLNRRTNSHILHVVTRHLARRVPLSTGITQIKNSRFTLLLDG